MVATGRNLLRLVYADDPGGLGGCHHAASRSRRGHKDTRRLGFHVIRDGTAKGPCPNCGGDFTLWPPELSRTARTARTYGSCRAQRGGVLFWAMHAVGLDPADASCSKR